MAEFPVGARVRDIRGPSYYGWQDVGIVIRVREDWRVIEWDRPSRDRDAMLVRHLEAE